MVCKNQYISLSDLRCLNPHGRMFFVFTAYMDESYDPAAMCVGGWLNHEDRWKKIESAWKERIDYENRKSEKKGLPKISRYHASDLENLKGKEYGCWTKDRQVIFTKKLIDILGREKKPLDKPIGIGCGVKLPFGLPTFPPEGVRRYIYKTYWAAYRLCVITNLLLLSEIMEDFFPREEVAVIHDRGDWNSAAQSAFDSFRASGKKNIASIVTVAPMDWTRCIALQPVDMFAYEGRKSLKAKSRNPRDFRPSLRRIMGHEIPIHAKEITKELLQKIVEARSQAPEPPADWIARQS